MKVLYSHLVNHQWLLHLYIFAIKNLPQDSSVKFYNYLQNKVFAENKVDSIIFSNSYNYYSTDSKKIDAIYTAVIDSLSLRESRKVLK